MHSGSRPESILLVTGAYYPEISAAGVQCRAAAAALAGRVRFGVLTTAVDRSLPSKEVVDGVVVWRVAVDVRSWWSKARASAHLLAHMARMGGEYDVVHLHGFSQKNVPVTVAARLAGKPIVMTLHTAGQDEPGVVRRQGPLAYRAFAAADLVLAVSPNLRDAYLQAGLPPGRLRLAPNGIDTSRFRPVGRDERVALRRELGLPADRPVVLFVGFFSRDKRPDVLFRAWQGLVGPRRVRATLLFAGETEPTYHEIDAALAAEIREAARQNHDCHVFFAGRTHEIERCFQAADVFALPSAREANPLALLEAMACGLPCVASRLEGATDVIIEHGRNGLLVPPGDVDALADALAQALDHGSRVAELSRAARATVEASFDIRRTAEVWWSAYQDVLV